MNCPKCNASLMQGFKYCPYCGKSQQPKIAKPEPEFILEYGGFQFGERVKIKYPLSDSHSINMINRAASAIVLALVPAYISAPEFDREAIESVGYDWADGNETRYTIYYRVVASLGGSWDVRYKSGYKSQFDRAILYVTSPVIGLENGSRIGCLPFYKLEKIT